MHEPDYRYLIQDTPKINNKYNNLDFNDETALTFHISGECLSQFIYIKAD